MGIQPCIILQLCSTLYDRPFPVSVLVSLNVIVSFKATLAIKGLQCHHLARLIMEKFASNQPLLHMKALGRKMHIRMQFTIPATLDMTLTYRVQKVHRVQKKQNVILLTTVITDAFTSAHYNNKVIYQERFLNIFERSLFFLPRLH